MTQAKNRLSGVGVVIVTHQNADLALHCASEVCREVAEDDVVVVVNRPEGVPPSSLAAIRSRLPHVVVGGKPLGYGANANRGVEVLRRLGDYDAFVVLNDDAIPDPGSLGELRRVLAEHADVGLVGPVFVNSERARQEGSFRFPTVLSVLSMLVILPAALHGRLRTRVEVYPAGTDGRVDWVLGAALMIRAEAWSDVGGFDDRYFLYAEETDLAFRVTQAGWNVRTTDSATVVHIGQASTGSRFGRMMASSRATYVRAHWSTLQRATLSLTQPMVLAVNVLSAGLAIASSPRRASARLSMVRAHWDARLRLREIWWG